MKIQFLNGGLANQAYQYIFARYYELSHPGECMYMDDTYFALHTVHNGYELEKVFGIRPHMLSECFDEGIWCFILEERKKGKSIPQIFRENQVDIHMLTEASTYETFNPFEGEVIRIPANAYYPEILDVEREKNIYYHGYWLNKNWFEKYQNIFREEFCFPEITDEKNLQYQKQILSENSISVHVRRGDYVTLKWDLETEAYRRVLEAFTGRVSERWHLFVFSDDIVWCQEHAQELGFEYFQNVTYIEGNIKGSNYRDMQLMAMCKGMIISNSAFCHLAALLNTRKQYVINLSDREI